MAGGSKTRGAGELAAAAWEGNGRCVPARVKGNDEIRMTNDDAEGPRRMKISNEEWPQKGAKGTKMTKFEGCSLFVHFCGQMPFSLNERLSDQQHFCDDQTYLEQSASRNASNECHQIAKARN